MRLGTLYDKVVLFGMVVVIGVCLITAALHPHPQQESPTMHSVPYGQSAP
jgi:hypothetical protein